MAENYHDRPEWSYSQMKLILNRYAPLSVDMAKAIRLDQADSEGSYVDNKPAFDIVDAELGEKEEEEENVAEE